MLPNETLIEYFFLKNCLLLFSLSPVFLCKCMRACMHKYVCAVAFGFSCCFKAGSLYVAMTVL